MKLSKFNIITLEQEELWNSTVKSFKGVDVYYYLEYLKAFAIHGDGIPQLYFYEADNLRAINVVMKRDISLDLNFLDRLDKGEYFDLITPYGYGGFIVEGDTNPCNLDKLKEAYLKVCSENNIVCEFVRFHPVINNQYYVQHIYNITELGKTVTLDLSDKNLIWSNFDSKNRNMIRKSLKSGVSIYWGRNSELFETFIEMYNMTMDRDNASAYYYFKEEFYDSIKNDLKYNSLIFYAEFEGKIIAMSIILFSNKKINYHLSASLKEFQYLAPSNLILSEVAFWGAENGYDTLHLGGGLGSMEDNLYKFKKVFNKNSNTYFSIGKKIFNEEIYAKLIDMRMQKEDFNKESNFFPLYRS